MLKGTRNVHQFKEILNESSFKKNDASCFRKKPLTISARITSSERDLFAQCWKQNGSHTALSNVADRRRKKKRERKKQATDPRCVLHTCEQTSKRGHGERVWWPLSCRPDKKFSFKTAGSGTTLCPGTEGAPFRREGTHNGAGRVSLGVCPIYTATASDYETRETSAPFCPSAACTLRNIGADKPTVHCGTPRAIPANRAGAWRFYYEKAKR